MSELIDSTRVALMVSANRFDDSKYAAVASQDGLHFTLISSSWVALGQGVSCRSPRITELTTLLSRNVREFAELSTKSKFWLEVVLILKDLFTSLASMWYQPCLINVLFTLHSTLSSVHTNLSSLGYYPCQQISKYWRPPEQYLKHLTHITYLPHT